MAGNGISNRILCNIPTRTLCLPFNFLRQISYLSMISSPSIAPRRGYSYSPLVVVSASKKFSPRTGRFDSKNKRSSTKTKEEEELTPVIGTGVDGFGSADGNIGTIGESGVVDDGYFLPELPGDKPDFWEGTQWDALGFFVQYMWAFGIVFALIACGIAVATYNEGATDFKETPVYKESIQSRELLEEPDSSNSDVFEGNPTEEAPGLE